MAQHRQRTREFPFAGVELALFGTRDVGAPRRLLGRQLELFAVRLGVEPGQRELETVEVDLQLLTVGPARGQVELNERIALAHSGPLGDEDVLDDAALEVLDHLDLAERHDLALGGRYLVQFP